MFKIFAGNLHQATTEEDLREVFAPHIEVDDVVIVKDPKTGKPKGYGFVMTRDAEGGRAAIRKLGRLRLNNRPVVLQEATGKPAPKPTPRPIGGRPRRPRRPRPRPGRP